MSNCAFPAARAALSRVVAPGLLLLLGMASPASAQLWTLPPPVKLMDITVRGIDSSYDPVHDVFLSVGAFGVVSGTFANSVGEPIGSPFGISTGGAHTNYPRVQYSQDLNGGSGGFLVAWSSEDGTIRSRVVAYPGVLVGTEQIIAAEPGGVSIESAPAIAYSATSRVFLVVWAEKLLTYIRARLVGLDGAPIGGVAHISAGVGKTPGVAWNPHRNEFGISYSGESGSSAFSAFAILPASNIDSAQVIRNSFNFLPGGLTYITDLAFSPSTGRYVMTWYEWPNSVVAAFDQSGTLLFVSPVSSRIGVYDSLSISFNPVSQTFLVAGLDPQNDFLTGAELAGNGVKIGFDTQLIGAGPAYYARSTPSTNAPMWQTLISRDLKLTDRVVFTGTTGGGSGSTPPPPPPSGGSTTPPPPPSDPSSCPGGPIPGMTCVNGNWLPTGSTGTSGGNTSSCPGGPIPGMVCVNGNWIPDSGAGSGTSTSSCPGGPIPGMVCVNGNWLPDSGAGAGTSTSSCPGGPIPGMVCVNGNWLPDSGAGAGTSASNCPGGSIPGMTCVNGNWIPNTSLASSSTSSCPGGAIPGMTCVNGNWIPNTSLGTAGSGGCPGSVPGMTCVNGNWIPDSSLGTTSSSGGGCPGTVPGMVCVNGNWQIDTGASTTSTSGCPGTVPGMTCVNGNWIPNSSRLEPAREGEAGLVRRLALAEPATGAGLRAARSRESEA